MTQILGVGTNNDCLEIVRKYKNIEREEHDRFREIAKKGDGGTYSLKYGEHNRDKNRYLDVLPYDYNRVKIDADGYINASYIELGSSRYVATQGPISSTVSDFWKMCDYVCKKRIVIVMLTPLIEKQREKCCKYWSCQNFSIVDSVTGCRAIQLDFISQRYDDRGHFKVTKWKMYKPDRPAEVKDVFHFYYDKWEDFSRPSSYEHVIELSQQVAKVRDAQEPVIVHCSAGVGRTGTFIAIDHLLNSMKETTEVEECADHVDPVEDVVRLLRKQRMLMVQRPQQYQFVYDTIRKYSETNGA
ncbi:hypothetical protein FOA43_001006 [Brettanomyces nanus]|uniref:Protein tyrosine phosphatase n=1 Tax=Eeniella nana TaxID=13502 RepID=A0A875RYI8_EENNA|nr:uncharacterized protein FOA43_001006 [Brettanomyces nanus]QPG73693.1 hypothetical protein FOA43_001006 [Brettanomyces nanus]